MPTDGPMFGEDTYFQIADGGTGTPGGAFVSVADLTGIDPPSNQTPVVERKLLSVPGRKVRVPGRMIDPGTASFSCETKYGALDRFRKLQFPASVTDPNDDREWGFRIWYPDGTQMPFTGFVTQVRADKVDGGQIVAATVTFQITSLVGLAKVTPRVP